MGIISSSGTDAKIKWIVVDTFEGEVHGYETFNEAYEHLSSLIEEVGEEEGLEGYVSIAKITHRVGSNASIEVVA